MSASTWRPLGDKIMAEMSISFTTGTGMTNLRHNNRELTEKEFNEPAHKHIKRDLSQNNIVIKQESLDEVYEREFGEALKKYNAKQKRKDRIITDYKNHVYHSKSLDLQREFIVGLGKKSDWDNLSPEMKQQAGEKIAEYIQEFEVRHPQLKIFNAVVHLDEAGAPHAHFNVVPVATGYKKGLEKQPSFTKALYQEGNHTKGRGQYREFRKEEVAKLEEKLKELGYDRKLVGTNNIKDMHEYKEIVGQANKELDEKLVSKYGAPEYINETTGEYYDWVEYHNFLEFPSEEQEGQIARETTYAEKIDWVKRYYQQDLNKLESSQKLSEARISELDQKIKKKYEELSKIDFKASKGASRVSQLENAIDSRSDALAAVKRDFKAYQAFLKRGEQIANNWQQEITGELKKTAFGKEYIRMDPEVFEKARMSNHWFQVKQDSLRQEIRRLETDLENSNRVRFKLLDENKELKAESKWLREDNKKLFERLDITTKKLKLWRDKTRKLLPKKEFKAITAVVNTEIIEIMTPVAKVVKAVTKTIKKMTL